MLLLVYNTDVNVKVDEEDQQYREYLYEATQGALQEVVENLNDTSENMKLWTENNRKIFHVLEYIPV